jgi:hypothetical protein
VVLPYRGRSARTTSSTAEGILERQTLLWPRKRYPRHLPPRPLDRSCRAVDQTCVGFVKADAAHDDNNVLSRSRIGRHQLARTAPPKDLCSPSPADESCTAGSATNSVTNTADCMPATAWAAARAVAGRSGASVIASVPFRRCRHSRRAARPPGRRKPNHLLSPPRASWRRAPGPRKRGKRVARDADGPHQALAENPKCRPRISPVAGLEVVPGSGVASWSMHSALESRDLAMCETDVVYLAGTCNRVGACTPEPARSSWLPLSREQQARRERQRQPGG